MQYENVAMVNNVRADIKKKENSTRKLVISDGSGYLK